MVAATTLVVVAELHDFDVVVAAATAAAAVVAATELEAAAPLQDPTAAS